MLKINFSYKGYIFNGSINDDSSTGNVEVDIYKEGDKRFKQTGNMPDIFSVHSDEYEPGYDEDLDKIFGDEDNDELITLYVDDTKKLFSGEIPYVVWKAAVPIKWYENTEILDNIVSTLNEYEPEIDRDSLYKLRHLDFYNYDRDHAAAYLQNKDNEPSIITMRKSDSKEKIEFIQQLVDEILSDKKQCTVIVCR